MYLDLSSALAYLKMKALHSFEISGNTDPATLHHHPEDPNRQWHCCGNLKSHMFYVLFDYYTFLHEAVVSEPDHLTYTYVQCSVSEYQTTWSINNNMLDWRLFFLHDLLAEC
jgi:hypothetical protein